MPSSAIVLFARSPEREAAAKRMPSAVPLFHAVVSAWLDASRRHNVQILIACTSEDRDALASIAPHIARGWIEQRGPSFGDRVANAAEDAFACGHDAVILAAIDAPPHDLGRALDALARGIAVVAPARDGGVNFLGITSVDRALLENLTTQRCREHFARLLVVDPATDIDSTTALDAARREKVWRAYLTPPIVHCDIAANILHGISPAHVTRPPPVA